jgi:GTP-binding protein YchF
VDLGIIGLPASGKTSLWNALTGSAAEVGAYSGRNEPHVGVVRVPDERVELLAELYDAKKRTHAEIRWVDYPVAAFASSGPDAKLLGELAQMDALVLVARAFEEPSVPAPDGVDALRDIETVELELAYADLGLIERRLGRIEPELRSLRAGERGPLEQEQALLRRLQAGLEEGVALRAQELSEAERKRLSGYALLTRRPLLIVVNVGEEDVARAAEIEAEFAERLGGPSSSVVALSARLEAEVAALDPEEAAEFRRELGLAEASPVDRLVQEAYALLGVHSFLTAGKPESRAWTLRVGGTALEAAGRIHSDIERGFIRAEVARWDELLEAGSLAELRKQGKLRTEGRDYVVQEGDVIEVLFNV